MGVWIGVPVATRPQSRRMKL